MKSTWSILNEVINNKKARVIYKRRLMFLFSTSSLRSRRQPHRLQYFKYIGPNLANSIPPCLTSHLSFLSRTFVNSLYQEPTTEQEILLKFVVVFVQELLQAITKLL